MRGGTLFGGLCFGNCEGEGLIPVATNDRRERYRRLAEEAEAQTPSDDGWHMVRCPDCNASATADSPKGVNSHD
jgi:hypothetical protein